MDVDIDMDIFSFTSNGKKVEGTGSVFPICDQLSDGTVEFLGTGFFITHNGIFVTAKHVLEGTTNPFIIHMLPNNEYYSRPISTADLTHTGDLAVGTLYEMKDSKGNMLTNDRLILSTYVPKPAEAISTFAYPESEIAIDEHHDPARHSFNIIPRQYSGVVVKVEMNGIRKVTTSPAVLCTIDSLPGNSGGPVFAVNGGGGVIGINTSGMRGVYHIVSLIEELKSLKIDNIKLPDSDSLLTLTIEQMADIGLIKFIQ